MNNKDLQKIEKSLNIKPPKHYKDFILDYPDFLKETDAMDFALMTELDRLIDQNKRFRGIGQLKDYFIIGQNGCGDCFLIKLDSKDKKIYGFNHESGKINLMADNLAEYAKLIKDDEKFDNLLSGPIEEIETDFKEHIKKSAKRAIKESKIVFAVSIVAFVIFVTSYPIFIFYGVDQSNVLMAIPFLSFLISIPGLFISLMLFLRGKKDLNKYDRITEEFIHAKRYSKSLFLGVGVDFYGHQFLTKDQIKHHNIKLDNSLYNREKILNNFDKATFLEKMKLPKIKTKFFVFIVPLIPLGSEIQYNETPNTSGGYVYQFIPVKLNWKQTLKIMSLSYTGLLIIILGIYFALKIKA